MTADFVCIGEGGGSDLFILFFLTKELLTDAVILNFLKLVQICSLCLASNELLDRADCEGAVFIRYFGQVLHTVTRIGGGVGRS